MTRAARHWAMLGALPVMVLTGCRFAAPDYDGTQYLCPDGVCPDGYACVAGECVLPAATDGAVADAAVLDAPPAPPDAPLAPPDAGPPVTLVFGESPNADITGVTTDCDLNQSAPTLNYGLSSDITVTELAAYEWRGLLRFDLSAIPAGATVLSAELHLVTSSGNPVTSALIYFYEVTEAWDEGIHNGGMGQASWDDRLPGTPWTAAGAALGSHSAGVQGQVTVTGPNEPHSISLSTDLVQKWVDGRSSNHGLMLNPVTTTTELVEFEAREAPDPTERPWLEITFQP